VVESVRGRAAVSSPRGFCVALEMDDATANIGARHVRITVAGIVQGVGFRPFVYRLARECGITGTVRNTGHGVVIEAHGAGVADFVRRLPEELPPLALLTDFLLEHIPADDAREFTITASAAGPVTTALIPADVALCEDCRRELLDPADRRHHYPFINCTNCGPRYTITAGIPYDRPTTSMRDFPLCAACAAEYHDPDDRRFHAQPNACPDCGPALHFVREGWGDSRGAVALADTVTLLREGGIVAIRGLGGYHLAVDARNEEAVRRLRLRKRRFEKPLAVMLRDCAMARALCELTAAEETLLSSPQRPIVIVRSRATGELADSMTLGNPTLGIMLPYTPLHVLLCEEMDALVMTSANLSEEPICIGIEEASQRLAGIADAFLHHNRDILQRCDDSVYRVIDEQPQPVRRSRGYVPRPILLDDNGPVVLAVGAELKNTICLASGRSAVLSQHIGDLEHLETLRFLEECVRHLTAVFQAEPEVLAHDMHPGYLGTQWATGLMDGALRERFAQVPRLPVQHHHAHLAACLAEHRHAGPALGIILDGTGYGSDGESWGGEFLVGDAHSVQRVGRFRPLRMPGADKAIREPWRMAWSALLDSGLDPERDAPAFAERIDEQQRDAVRFALAADVNAPWSSGCGRLFDAVAALVGVRDVVSFEAQAAIELEHCAGDTPGSPLEYDIDEGRGTAFELSFLPTVVDITKLRGNGHSPREMSARFHATVIAGCVDMTRRLLRHTGVQTVVLSGGVFQNALLLSGMRRALSALPVTVLTHTRVPANDGGIALGQVCIARAMLKQG